MDLKKKIKIRKDENQTERSLVIGTNGTGKSTLLHNTLKKSTKNRPAIVIDNEGWEPTWRRYPRLNIANKASVQEHRKGIKVVVYSAYETKEGNPVLDYLLSYAYDGIVVFDDAKMYMQQAPKHVITKLMIRSRQRWLDLHFVVHGFSDVPPTLFTYVTTIFLFRTRDALKRKAQNFMNPELVMRAQKEVNAKAKKDRHYYETLEME